MAASENAKAFSDQNLQSALDGPFQSFAAIERRERIGAFEELQ